jgi:hypothetical protein
MKKITILLLMMLPVFFACEKEKEMEDKMEGNAGEVEDSYGLNEKELAQVQTIKQEILLEIRKGDSITITALKHELDSLKAEIHKLKGKK